MYSSVPCFNGNEALLLMLIRLGKVLPYLSNIGTYLVTGLVDTSVV